MGAPAHSQGLDPARRRHAGPLYPSDDLGSCPGGAHFGWWLEAWRQGVGPCERDAIGCHLLLSENWTLDQVAKGFVDAASSGRAVVEVQGWRTTRYGTQIVTYLGADGRLYDLIADLDPGSGLLLRAAHTRSAHGTDLGAKAISDLTDEERASVHEVFAAAYDHADHDFLDRRLTGLNEIGLGWRNEKLVGFTAGGGVDADLPVIGRRWFIDAGISCIDPSVQGMGLANAIGLATVRAFAPTKPHEFSVLHFATPVTLKAVFALRRNGWPGNSITEVAASLAHPTPAQRAVGAALAELGGATSYNADNWVMRSGQPAGASTTVPRDLEPEYAKLFAPVDRTRGDALLGIFWYDEPPPEWWT